MQSIAVVGGFGFLGRHVGSALEAAGWTVRALSRRNGFDASRPDPELLRGVDAVVNLAGIKREDRKQTFESVHVDLVRNLVAAMKAAGIRRLIHVSVVVARSAPGLPYHDTKWRGEEIVRASGLDYTILRPGVIYGEGDDMLSHLALMIRNSPIFPIVENGSSPMRPVDVRDVAAAVVSALQSPVFGKSYDIVGPDRMDLRKVVQTVAEGLNLPVSIFPTPVAIMRTPVRIMEAIMKQPLSTSAQLTMLAEGLDGDPAPARQDLNLVTAPFTALRLRPILARTNRTAPFSLRLFSAPRPSKEITGIQFWVFVLFSLSAMTYVFRAVPDRWMGMTVAMSAALAGTMFLSSIRRRLKPTVFRVVTGLFAGAVHYAATLLVLRFLSRVWPEWEGAARTLYAWRAGHSPLLIVPTFLVILLAEELLWRGIVTRYLIERCGRVPGIVYAAAIYTLAHWATLNPLLLIAAFGSGLYWGWLYTSTDDLVTPTVAHLLWDVLLLFLFPVVH
jgi:uncharacterized protein YbjT (DUF2867 family)/membrane protease YdiL (CAAX protease family)